MHGIEQYTVASTHNCYHVTTTHFTFHHTNIHTRTEICTINTPEAALRWCASARDVETFKSRVLSSSQQITLESIDDGQMMCAHDIAAELIDWRYIHLNLIDQYCLP